VVDLDYNSAEVHKIMTYRISGVKASSRYNAESMVREYIAEENQLRGLDTLEVMCKEGLFGEDYDCIGFLTKRYTMFP